jgi:hypothetical protein
MTGHIARQGVFGRQIAARSQRWCGLGTADIADDGGRVVEMYVGDKADPETTAPFEPIVILGSDPRLQSQFGSYQGDVLRIDKVPTERHRVLYGPHVTLPAGHYRFELAFEMETPSPRDVEVDLSSNWGTRAFYGRQCFEWELTRGLIRISHPFKRPVEQFELRLYASGGFVAAVRQLTIRLFAE